MTYKKRTEIAESTASEKKGRRESKTVPETTKAVIRSAPESPQTLGFFSHSTLNGEIWTQDHWRAGDEETENYTYAIALQNDT